MTFKSKIGTGIILPLIIIIIPLSILFVVKEIWVGLLLNVLISAFICHMIFTTRYFINNKTDLIITCGFFINKTVSISTIKKIVETNNPISSPALSLDRLELFYNNFDSIIISPKEKKEFINNLQLINKGIEVILKKKNANR